jgi:hypothetical protein
VVSKTVALINREEKFLSIKNEGEEMKRQFLILIAIAAFATALATNASGQTRKTTRTNVEFDFQIGDRIYPAGQYQIESISDQRHLLRISNLSNAKKTQTILANHSQLATRTQTPKLVFLKDGEGCFLTQMFLESGEWGYSITASRRQRDSEKHLASRIARKTEVRLAK